MLLRRIRPAGLRPVRCPENHLEQPVLKEAEPLRSVCHHLPRLLSHLLPQSSIRGIKVVLGGRQLWPNVQSLKMARRRV